MENWEKAMKMNLVFSSSVGNLEYINSSFDRGVMRIAYHGRNDNKTFIEKRAFEEAIPSMFNCPVVCNYNRNEDMIGGHDMQVVNKDGVMKIVNITSPVGVVPESAKTWWEMVEEPDGEAHEYLCTEILLWKRQEAYAHIKENGITDESMEIGVLNGFRAEDGYFHVESFEFHAFCLLESVRPCFESAGIEVFSLDFKNQYSEMMEDFKREFSQVMTASADDIQKNFSKGGNDEVSVDELMQKYGLTAEEIDFVVDGMNPDELEEKFAQIQEKKQAAPAEVYADEEGNSDDAVPLADDLEDEPEEESPAPEEEHNDDSDDDEPPVRRPNEQNFSLTSQQFMSELFEALCAEKYTDPVFGEVCRYWYLDHDIEAGEAYVYDTSDDRMYGLTYSCNGDHVVVDFESKKRKKIVYADFDEGDAVFSMRQFMGEFRANLEKRSAAETEVFAKFADLNGNEMFEKLRGECKEMPIEQIEEKCFAIRGRNAQINFSLDNSGKAPRVPIERLSAKKEEEPYGGIFAKYNVGAR